MAREDHAAGRPLLAALAVSRTQKGPDGGGIPGRGFFQLLTELGRYDGPDQGPEAAAQHARELQARSEEHTSELQSLMRSSYAVFCLKKKNTSTQHTH